MCVSQFRDYCNASKFTREPANNEKIHYERGTFYESGSAWYYVTDRKQMASLAKSGNAYAKELTNEDN